MMYPTRYFFRPVSNFSSFLEDFFENTQPEGSNVGRLNLFEKDGEYLAEIDLPGFKKEEVQVEVVDQVLRVKGQRSVKQEQEGKVFRKERRDVQVDRSFRLPDPIDAEKVQAEMVDGILSIRMKKNEPQVKKQLVAIQ